MKNLRLVSLCLLLPSGQLLGQQPEPSVALKLNRPEQITSRAASAIQSKVVDLLKTSNFNSKDHVDPAFPDGARGVHRRYRETIGGQYLVVAFPRSRQLELIRGQATAVEIIVGLNHPKYTDALFTIDPDGRVVEHSKFSGELATDLLELVRNMDRS